MANKLSSLFLLIMGFVVLYGLPNIPDHGAVTILCFLGSSMFALAEQIIEKIDEVKKVA